MSGSKAKKSNSEEVLDLSYLDKKNQKVRITTFVDGDVLAWLKLLAEQSDKGYQTILNELLRNAKDSGAAKRETVYFQKFDISHYKPEEREAILSFVKHWSASLKHSLHEVRKEPTRPKSAARSSDEARPRRTSTRARAR